MFSPLYRQLIRQTQAWALGDGFDAQRAADLRRQAILANHVHYLECIPVYKRFAREEGAGLDASLELLQNRLMLPDEIFKSYNQVWLDEGDYARMNTWLSEIFHRPVEVDMAGVNSIDSWIERLNQQGLRLVYSSGTSGNFSFIPRDRENWELFTTASRSTLAPLLARRGAGAWWQRRLIPPAVRLLSPDRFASLVRRLGVREYAAYFLDFVQGHTGNQTLSRELAGLFRTTGYLYETQFSPATLRLLARGPKNAVEQAQLDQLQELVGPRQAELHAILLDRLHRSVAAGQKIFIFGVTRQYKDFCKFILEHGQGLRFKTGSLVVFGGGWKSFQGEQISRDELLNLIAEAFGLPLERILEGYSMTEINAFMLRCQAGRFHIPPTVEPVIFDAGLAPIQGPELHGIFGFMDTLARAYPGFIISGDEVHYLAGGCPCGLEGPALTEVGRGREREIKGCGGIMASLKA